MFVASVVALLGIVSGMGIFVIVVAINHWHESHVGYRRPIAHRAATTTPRSRQGSGARHVQRS